MRGSRTMIAFIPTKIIIMIATIFIVYWHFKNEKYKIRKII